MFEEGDLDLDDEVTIEEEQDVMQQEEGTTTEGRKEKGQMSYSIPPRFPRVNRPLRKQQTVEKLLDNPSIQLHPQHHTQVRLDAVQSLSDVFNQLYVQDASSGYSTGTQSSWEDATMNEQE